MRARMDKKLRKLWLKLYSLKLEDIEDYLSKRIGEDNFLIDNDGGLYVKIARRYWYLIFPQFWSPDKSVDDYIKPVTAEDFHRAMKRHS
ncbi:MAG: hypothetical protein QXG39_10065 [Candidatus Aenigmatarchaeota archaeon]